MLKVVRPVRPLIMLPDVFFISAIHAVIMESILRIVKVISAIFAAITDMIRRMRVVPRS